MVDYSVVINTAANMGVAVAVALYMVYWVTQKLNGKLDRIADKLAEIAEKETLIADRLERLINREK